MDVPTPEILTNTKLEVIVKNVKPVELTDFTLSLLAMSNNYERYIKANKLELGPNKLRFYVKEVRPGSHIVDIFASPESVVSAAYCAATVCQVPINYMEYANTVIDFTKYLGAFFGFYLGKNKEKPENIEKKDLENGKQMFELVTKDVPGASIGFSAVQGNVTVVQNVYNFTDSNTIQNAINRELKQDPTQKFYDQVVLRLDQGRVSSTDSGSFGIIEDIHSQRVKIHFKTETVREKIVGTTENPFSLFFLVDVDVSRTELSDKPVLYNIIQVHGEPWSIA